MNSTSSHSSNGVATRRAIRATNASARAEMTEKLKDEGNKLYRNGDYLAAANFYVMTINRQGSNPVLLSNLAAAYLKLELFDEAEWAATTALEYDPRMIKARYRRAIARKEIFCFKSSKSDLESILTQDPNNEDAKRELEIINRMMESEPGLDEEEHEQHPRYDDEPWDLWSDSETEDCTHVGNKIPCRFYNHDGCARGVQCKFSHAPDAKSVRDELGKNVCIHSLFGDCTFGAAKCLYSHSRTHLPTGGWWNDPKQVQAAKTLFPLVDCTIVNYDDLHEALILHPEARAFAARYEREAICEYLQWQFDIAMDGLDSPQAFKPTVATERFVLVLSFEWEDGSYSGIPNSLLSDIQKKAKLIHVRNSPQAREQVLEYIDSPLLVSVLITDIGISKKKYAGVLKKLVAYAKNGGTVVIGGLFSTMINPKIFDDFMKNTWGLDWKYGSYFRSTFCLNPSNEIVQRNPSLIKSYSMKSLHVANIQPEMAIYRQNDDSRLESLVFTPVKAKDISEGEAPAVCARVGRGRLAFLGDVNAETSSANTLLAMLGVLDQAHESPAVPSAAATKTEPKTQNAVAGSSKETRSSKAAQGQDGKATELDVAVDVADTSPKITDKFVLLIELEGDSVVRRTFAHQLSELSERIAVKDALDARQAMTLLDSPSLHGVYVIDEGIQNIQNIGVLMKLGQYAKSGGLVVFGGMFPIDMDRQSIAMIFSIFDLTWSAGSYCKAEAQLNRHHETALRNPSLCDAFYMKAVHLRGFHAENLFYEQYFDEYETNPNFQAPGGDAWEAPVLRARVGKGHVGYIGDVGPEPESTGILLAMLELLTPPKVLERDTTKFLMMLTYHDEETLQQFIPGFMEETREKVELLLGLSKSGLSKARVIDLLPSPDLVGVLVTDASILQAENAFFLSKLVEYSKNGGTLVFGYTFCKIVTLTQFRPLFRDNWGLNWDMVGVHGSDTSVKRNGGNALFKGKRSEDLKLPETTRLTGIHIKGIVPSMAVYFPLKDKSLWNPESNVYKASTLYTKVEKGHLGYVGSASLDGAERDILYMMFGLV